MPQKPDGKPAKSVAVTFTRPAAERIARVVRTVERSGRDTKGPVSNLVIESGRAIKLCTFTGQWLIQDTKSVRFASDTNVTASVINLLFSVGDSCTAQNAYVSLVADPAQPAGVNYHLVNVQHFETPIVTDIALGTAAIEFTRKLVWLPCPGVTAAQFINISTATSC